ncbi:MAG: TonB-dependent receptor [Gammaproteobacteria bacterium]
MELLSILRSSACFILLSVLGVGLAFAQPKPEPVETPNLDSVETDQILDELDVEAILEEIEQQEAQVEEILVIERRRREVVQDVPASILVYSSTDIEGQGLVDIQALAPTIPNFSYSQSLGAGDVMVVRGLGSVGDGAHLEQGVGQIFNGFFTTRTRISRLSLIDLDQINLLRGPQGSLVGANATLGVINIIPNKPTGEFEFKLNVLEEVEASEGYHAVMVFSGPIFSGVRGRLVLGEKDQEGWIDNQYYRFNNFAENFPPVLPAGRAKKDEVLRLILDVDIGASSLLEVFYQESKFRRQGKPREITACNETARYVLQFISPAEDCLLNAINYSAGNLGATNIDLADTGVVTISPTALIGDEGFLVGEPFSLDFQIYGLTYDNVYDTTALNIRFSGIESTISDQYDYDLSPGWIHSIDELEIAEGGDTAEGTMPPYVRNREKFEQLNLEVSYGSSAKDPDDYHFTYGLGLFRSKLDFTQSFDSQFEYTQAGLGGTFTARRRHEVAETLINNYAFFGQANFRFSGQVFMTLGGRATIETKSATKSQYQYAYGTFNDQPNFNLCVHEGYVSESIPPVTVESTGLTRCFYDGYVESVNYDFEGKPLGDQALRDGINEEAALDFNVSLSCASSDEGRSYFTFSTGYKGSGFNIRSADGSAVGQQNFVYDNERSFNVEYGNKRNFRDESGLFNWSIYAMSVDGLQLVVNDSLNFDQNVVNGDALTYGVEWDFFYRFGNSFDLRLTGSLNRARYESYIGNCWISVATGIQTAAQGCIDHDDNVDTAPQQNLEGQAPPFSSDVALTLNLGWNIFGAGSIGGLRLDHKIYYASEYYLSPTQSPDALQEGVTRADVSLTWTSPNRYLELAIIGRNLTNELVRSWSDPLVLNYDGDISSVTSDDFIGQVGFVEETRAISLRANLHF